MIVALRISLMAIALALLAGVIFAGWQGDIARAVVYFALAATCGAFERIAGLAGKEE